MQAKELINHIKTDVSGFTKKTSDLKDHYLVKIQISNYVYENSFYALFEPLEEISDADNVVYANINFNNKVAIISILGTLDKRGFFKPLREEEFEGKLDCVGEICSVNENEELYVRDFVVKTDNIGQIEIVTYL